MVRSGFSVLVQLFQVLDEIMYSLRVKKLTVSESENSQYIPFESPVTAPSCQ